MRHKFLIALLAVATVVVCLATSVFAGSDDGLSGIEGREYESTPSSTSISTSTAPSSAPSRSKLPPAYDSAFWGGILEDIQDAQPGDTVTAAAYLEKNIPASLLEALAQKEDVTLELDYYFYTLTIPSSEVKPVEERRIYYPLNDLYNLYTGEADAQ